MFGLLQWAVATPDTQASVIPMLLEHCANPHRGLTREEIRQHFPQASGGEAQHPLYIACEQGKAGIVRVLLAHGLHGRAPAPIAHNTTPAPTHNTTKPGVGVGESTQASTETRVPEHHTPAPTHNTPALGAGGETRAATGTGALAHNNTPAPAHNTSTLGGGEDTQVSTETRAPEHHAPAPTHNIDSTLGVGEDAHAPAPTHNIDSTLGVGEDAPAATGTGARAHSALSAAHNTSIPGDGEGTHLQEKAGARVQSAPSPTHNNRLANGVKGSAQIQAQPYTSSHTPSQQGANGADVAGAHPSQARVAGGMTAPAHTAPHNDNSSAHVTGAHPSPAPAETEMPVPAHTAAPQHHPPAPQIVLAEPSRWRIDPNIEGSSLCIACEKGYTDIIKQFFEHHMREGGDSNNNGEEGCNLGGYCQGMMAGFEVMIGLRGGGGVGELPPEAAALFSTLSGVCASLCLSLSLY